MPIFKISGDGKAVEEFHEYDRSEEELRSLFELHGLRFVEKGLQFVDRNVPAGPGFIDTLVIDDAKRPTIIEYKIDEDASPDALVQALSYAYHLQKDQEYYARYITKKLTDLRIEDIDFDNTRIIVVAPDFKSHVKDAAQLVEPHIKLVRYSGYKTSESEALSITTIFDSTSARGPVTRSDYSIDWHFSGRYTAMKPTFERLCAEVKTKLNVDPYYRKQFIAFKRNYIFIDMHVYTDRLDLGLTLPSETNVSSRFQRPREAQFGSRVTRFVKISSPTDVDSELMQAITEAYNNS